MWMSFQFVCIALPFLLKPFILFNAINIINKTICMVIMDDNARLKLNQMIQSNNVSDQTEMIRNLKHSETLRDNVNTMIRLKEEYKERDNEFTEVAIRECYFLYSNYTDIFNKIKKEEIDIAILFQFLDVLQKIENKELDQHEGSFEVGTLLKKIYIDSALRKANKLDENRPEPVHISGSAITWKDFKKTHF
jgi:hypothetical protein